MNWEVLAIAVYLLAFVVIIVIAYSFIKNGRKTSCLIEQLLFLIVILALSIYLSSLED